MSDVFKLRMGDFPLLISVPHDGRNIAPTMRGRMTDAGLALPDTDWHVARLYNFATELGASIMVANYSRYVVDLNRPADDSSLYPGQLATGLCPDETFAGAPLYKRGGVEPEEQAARLERYWHPYHEHIRTTLAAFKKRFGYALLWDAHSIPSEVPRLFEGELPVLNLGSNDGKSCGASIAAAVSDVQEASPFSSVVNGRFKGGYITRHYGKPEKHVHALQLEIAQRAYMSESSGLFAPQKADELRATLHAMLSAFLQAAKSSEQ